jgi:hypothetical protein
MNPVDPSQQAHHRERVASGEWFTSCTAETKPDQIRPGQNRSDARATTQKPRLQSTTSRRSRCGIWTPVASRTCSIHAWSAPITTATATATAARAPPVPFRSHRAHSRSRRGSLRLPTPIRTTPTPISVTRAKRERGPHSSAAGTRPERITP